MKHFQVVFYLLILSLVITSCKKTSQPVAPNIDLPEKTSIQNYLITQKVNNSPTRIKQIEKLNEHLVFNRLWVEKSNAHALIITPIDDLYLFANNKGNKVSNYFVCVVDSSSKIVTSYIIQNRPNNNTGKTDIKRGAIANMDDNNPVAEDCNIRYINIYDYYLYEKNYKDNKLVSVIVKNTKTRMQKNSASQNAIGSGCIDWYLQTFINGVLVEETYLYTDCGGTQAGGSGGGGGGGNGGSGPVDQPEEGVSVTRTVSFVVKEITTGSQARWKIEGSFTISGMVFTNTSNNYFTSISWAGTALINYNPAYDGLPSMLPYFTFTSSNGCGLIGTTTAKATSNGILRYLNQGNRIEVYPMDHFWYASTDLH